MTLLALWYRDVCFVLDSTVEESAASADQSGWFQRSEDVSAAREACGSYHTVVKMMKLVSLNGNVHNFTCSPLCVILKLPFNRANPPPTPPKAAKSYSQQKNYYTSKTSKSVFRECKWRDVICCLLYSTDMFVMHETGGLLKSRFSCGP